MSRLKILLFITLILAAVPFISACQSSRIPAAAKTIDRTVPAYVQKSDVEGIYNFSRIGQDTGFGGATEPSAMAELKDQGFTSVISLRMEGEKGFDLEASRAAAEAAGLDYIHLPLNTREPDSQVIDNIVTAMGDSDNQPPYVHCGSATRVAAMWMIKRVAVDGMTIEAAQSEAEAIAGKPEAAVTFATEYLKTH